MSGHEKEEEQAQEGGSVIPVTVRSITSAFVVSCGLLVWSCGSPGSESGSTAGSQAEESDAGTASSIPEGAASEAESTALPETNFYEISTSLGKMVVRLYDETPKHRDNFKKLVVDGTYDGTTFHRVIEGFMIQGGDPNSKDDDPMNDGSGGLGYTLEAEFRPALFHKRGALAAARQGDSVNPEQRSSSSQFYIVQGRPYEETDLSGLEQQMAARSPGFSFSEEARAAYLSEGGTPFLDGQYTVYGELVAGFEVLDAIAGVNTARKSGAQVHPALADQPPDRLSIQVRPLKDYEM
jgi:peptidyl-prolyl cis-trans isomerase B (cyclophilin B)